MFVHIIMNLDAFASSSSKSIHCSVSLPEMYSTPQFLFSFPLAKTVVVLVECVLTWIFLVLHCCRFLTYLCRAKYDQHTSQGSSSMDSQGLLQVTVHLEVLNASQLFTDLHFQASSTSFSICCIYLEPTFVTLSVGLVFCAHTTRIKLC